MNINLNIHININLNIHINTNLNIHININIKYIYIHIYIYIFGISPKSEPSWGVVAVEFTNYSLPLERLYFSHCRSITFFSSSYCCEDRSQKQAFRWAFASDKILAQSSQTGSDTTFFSLKKKRNVHYEKTCIGGFKRGGSGLRFTRLRIWRLPGPEARKSKPTRDGPGTVWMRSLKSWPKTNANLKKSRQIPVRARASEAPPKTTILHMSTLKMLLPRL